MEHLIALPLLADAGAIVTLLVVIFTVVGWLVNLANSQQNNQPAPPPQRPNPPRPKADRMQNEIDIFLQEVRGARGREDVVVVETPAAESTPRRTRSAPPEAPPITRRELGLPLGSSSSGLGTVAPQVASHVGETLASHHLDSKVGQPRESAFLAHPSALAQMAALQDRGGRAAQQSALPIVQMLKNRDSVRQAILINEILSRPLALRED